MVSFNHTRFFFFKFFLNEKLEEEGLPPTPSFLFKEALHVHIYRWFSGIKINFNAHKYRYMENHLWMFGIYLHKHFLLPQYSSTLSSFLINYPNILLHELCISVCLVTSMVITRSRGVCTLSMAYTTLSHYQYNVVLSPMGGFKITQLNQSPPWLSWYKTNP